MQILLSGASGFIGSYLKQQLEKEGYKVIPFKRKDPSFFSSHPMNQFDLVINLAGEPLFSLWTKRKKQKILDSRVSTTKRLVEEMEKKPPKRFFSASAIGFYGSREAQVSEESSSGNGFLSEVCRLWEKEAKKAETYSVAVTILRFGVVLGKKGMLSKLTLFAKLGLSTILGSGEQFISWIAIDDVAKAVSFLIQHPELEGPVNLVSGNPTSQKNLVKMVARHFRRPCFLKIPAFILKRSLGSFAEELLFANQQVVPEKLQKAGFTLDHKNIEDVLQTYYPRKEK